MSARLGYLLKKFPRLSETFVLNEILSQESLGRPVRVFSRRTPDEEPRHPQLSRLRAEVETLPDKRGIDPWETLFFGEWDPEETFARVGRVVRSAREWSHPRFPSLLAEAIYLYGRTRALGVEHLHVHFATDSAVVAMILRELGGPSYSVTAHAKDIYRQTVDADLLDRMFTNAEFVVTVCDANVRFIEGRVGQRAASRVRRLYNGIDLEAFEMVVEEREEDHVLAVGRLVEKKGFHVLVEALALLAARSVPFKATIAGDGDQRERLEGMIRESGLEGRVFLAGPVDQAGVRALMRRATVLCQPCVTAADGNRDALPTVLLEALASGLPAVSTPVGGVPEILGDGEAGVLVAEGDAAATARALEELLSDHDLRRRLALKGRARAESLFDAEHSARTLATWFDAALEKESEPCAWRA